MADLNPLIRWRKHVVEEKQRLLSNLFREAENLQAKKQAMEDELEREKQLAIADTASDSATLFGKYAEQQRKKIAQMDAAIQKINQRIALAQDDIRNAFADMKKVEITQRKREEREEAEENRKETIMLDDIGVEGFRRKGEEE